MHNIFQININNKNLFDDFTYINLSNVSIKNIYDIQNNIMNNSKYKKFKFLKFSGNKSRM